MVKQPEELIAKIRMLGGGTEALVEVDIDAFFDQNTDFGSIAPNLVDHPGPQSIYEVLRQLRDRSDVSSLVVVVSLEYKQYPDGEWPHGEAVHIVTSAPLSELDAFTRSINTNPAGEGPWQEVANPPVIPDGQRVVTIWWD